MSFVTLKDILHPAKEQKYGVGMFNILNLEMLRGIVMAAQEEKSPVIIGTAEVHGSIIPFEWASYMMKRAAAKLDTPVCLHFDHGTTKKAIFNAIHAGFTSVMYDGSALPYEENIANTREIVKEAKKYGVSVEAELGHVGGGEDGKDDGIDEQYTNVEQVADFVARTGIDALAVAIGTAHGKYIRKPVLDLKRLAEINKICPVGLVLHGGSGLSDDDFRNTIKNGITKVNICTDMCIAAAAAAKEKATKEEIVPAEIEAVKNVVKHKMQLFGSSSKASSFALCG